MNPASMPSIPRYASEDDEPLSSIRRRAIVEEPRSVSIEPVVIDEQIDVGAPSKSRRIVVRALGAVAVVASIVGLWRIGESSEARHALLQWGTLGHAQQAVDARDAVAKTVR